MNNKVCSNCGTINNSESTICKNCGRILYSNNKNIEEKTDVSVDDKLNELPVFEEKYEPTKEELRRGSIFGVIALVLFFGGGILFPILTSGVYLLFYYSFVPPLSLVSGILFAVYGRLNYPYNKFILFTFLSIILVTIILAIIFIYQLISCGNSCVGDFESFTEFVQDNPGCE